MSFGSIAFLYPWVFVGLIILPALWWLMRFSPPRPKQIEFPPTRLLKDLETKEQTPSHSPWWLMVLRALIASLIIVAFARPVLNPDRQGLGGSGPLILIIDNGWASAPRWQARRAMAEAVIDQAERASRSVMIIPTAKTDRTAGIPYGKSVSAHEAHQFIAALKPHPFWSSRLEVIALIERKLAGIEDAALVWLSDGLDHGAAQAFSKKLMAIADTQAALMIIRAEEEFGPLALNDMTHNAQGVSLQVLRAPGDKDLKPEGPRAGVLGAWSGRGAALGEATFKFKPGEARAAAAFKLPLELRNQITRIEILGERSAGAVYLMDKRTHRLRVGLVSGESGEQSQPLLSPLYYVRRALAPFAEVISPRDKNLFLAVGDLMAQNPSVLILTDVGKLAGKTLSQIETWVQRGGILVRFAGPRLEKGGDRLLPVALRHGGRALGGALSWSTPQPLAPFEESSPFYHLSIAEDITVSRQLLADPSQAIGGAEIWARLKDGTPLVTALKRKDGWLILFHVTANSEWSSLPLSGLFVEMLQSLLDLSDHLPLLEETHEGAQTTQKSSHELDQSTPLNASRRHYLPPLQTLDGFGRLSTPPPSAEPLQITEINTIKPSSQHPPGFYGTPSRPRAVNLMRAKMQLKRINDYPAKADLLSLDAERPRSLKPWFLVAALALFLIDGLAVIFISGGVQRLGGTRSLGGFLLLVCALCFGLSPVGNALATEAQPLQLAGEKTLKFSLEASLRTRLAYVITGDETLDQISAEGLAGLSRMIALRTTVEPAKPVGVHLLRDELVFFPILYWPLHPSAKALPEQVLAKIDAYMKQGGMVVFDTRDHNRALSFGDLARSPGAEALQRVLGKLDIPRLEPVPADHVIRKSFYLLEHFPGRFEGGQLWVEAGHSKGDTQDLRADRSDGVSSLLITSNDFAAAWAIDEENRLLYPVVPGGELQREMAFRVGINIVIYALTGNYKADQVHVPALLERLGE